MQFLVKSLHLREFWLLEFGRCPRQSRDKVVGSLSGEEIVEYPRHL